MNIRETTRKQGREGYNNTVVRGQHLSSFSNKGLPCFTLLTVNSNSQKEALCKITSVSIGVLLWPLFTHAIKAVSMSLSPLCTLCFLCALCVLFQCCEISLTATNSPGGMRDLFQLLFWVSFLFIVYYQEISKNLPCCISCILLFWFKLI